MSNILQLENPFPHLKLKSIQAELLKHVKFERHADNRKEALLMKEKTPYYYNDRMAERHVPFQKVPSCLLTLWDAVERATWCEYGACFINVYEGQSGEIGWHKDNSPSIDASKPVTVVTLGDARPIELRESADSEVISITPSHGSIYMMPPRFQEVYDHRVPEVSDPKAGIRISLVFRALSGHINY